MTEENLRDFDDLIETYDKDDWQGESLRMLVAEVRRLREVIGDIANILGTGMCTVANCPGCHYEMQEAAEAARAALRLATPGTLTPPE